MRLFAEDWSKTARVKASRGHVCLIAVVGSGSQMRPRNALSKFRAFAVAISVSIGALADACFAGYMQSFALSP